jgi:hypothetical protein
MPAESMVEDLMQSPPAKLSKVDTELDFGLVKLKAEWREDPAQKTVAWELYVELASRVSMQPLDLDDGLLREALGSLHALFATTRQILRVAGPGAGAATGSVGAIALSVLNRALRPFLTKWHPRLAAWEFTRRPDVAPLDHERAWEQSVQLRGELERVRCGLIQYARGLAEVAGVAPPGVAPLTSDPA